MRRPLPTDHALGFILYSFAASRLAGSKTRPHTRPGPTQPNLALFHVAQAGGFAPQAAKIEQAGAANF